MDSVYCVLAGTSETGEQPFFVVVFSELERAIVLCLEAEDYGYQLSNPGDIIEVVETSKDDLIMAINKTDLVFGKPHSQKDNIRFNDILLENQIVLRRLISPAGSRREEWLRKDLQSLFVKQK